MLNMTRYYDEFLRYHKMASWQQENCNLGNIPYSDSPFDDDLIKNVFLYDVVERKYAGFSQLLLDMWYPINQHPYKNKMDARRKARVENFNRVNWTWGLEEWLFIFFVHRLTGSGINYAKNPSGYHNSILLKFNNCFDIEEMVDIIKDCQGPKFTSIGYQIAPFPKPKDGYRKGGDWFLCEILPGMSRDFAKWLESSCQRDFRSIMKWLENFNKSRGFRVFHFQYAAVLADIADFMPDLVDIESHFFYGKNAIECLNYLADKPKGVKQIEFLDMVMERIRKDTGLLPYNAEDVACDCIRWIENYINPKLDYSHLCLDSIWSSHKIYDHPFGRQKPMLEMGLVKTFKGMPHPSDDKILKQAKMTESEYKAKINFDML